MSDGSKNTKNKKRFISDCSRSNITNAVIGMSVSSNKTENQSGTNNKVSDKTSEDPIHDSGILSDTNLSCEQFSSESIDLASTKFTSKKTDDTDYNIDKSEKELMTLDSGIDIGLSDQQCTSSNLETSSADLFSSASESELKSKSEQRSRQQQENIENKEAENSHPWQLYFMQDDDGNTQLHLAIMEGYDNVVSALLRLIPHSQYLDIRNDYCQTALHLSVLMDQPSIVRKLVLGGASTYIVDRFGNTALHLACEINSLECIKALLDPINNYEYANNILQYKPKIDFPYAYIDEYNYSGVTCVHVAAEMDKNLLILHELLLHNADINIRECKSGCTILHKTVSTGNENLIRYMLQHTGINLEVKTYAKLTAYQLSSNHPNIGKMLLDRGAFRLPYPEHNEDSDEEDESDDENETDYSSSNNISGLVLNQFENLHIAVTS